MKNNMSKYELLKEITALDFVMIDLQLYLNTHPMDQAALERYNAIVPQLDTLKKNYESCYGMLCVGNSFSPYPWQWISEPWPWEYEANFRLD